jgi:hypothetical protein
VTWAAGQAEAVEALGEGAASSPTVAMISGAAQQLEVVGDVAGAAAELAPHLGHEEETFRMWICSGRM